MGGLPSALPSQNGVNAAGMLWTSVTPIKVHLKPKQVETNMPIWMFPQSQPRVLYVKNAISGSESMNVNIHEYPKLVNGTV